MRSSANATFVRRCSAALGLAWLAACGGDGGGGTEPGGSAASPAVVQDFTGNNQQATAGTTLPSALVVEVLNARGAPVGGVAVTFTVTAGGGSVTPASAVTNSSGQARTTFTLGAAAGPQTVSAAVEKMPPVTFTAVGMAGAATRVAAVSGGDQTGAAGTLLATPVVLRVVDLGGNGVSGVPLTAAPAAGSGSFAFNAATTNAAGEVSGVWRLGTLPGPQRVVVSAPSGSLIAPIALSASAVPGPPDTVELVSGGSQSAETGDQLRTPLTVRVVDAFGNAVAGYDIAFAATLGGGQMTPASATTDASGRASAVWTLGTVVGTQRATATAVRPDGSRTHSFEALAVAPSKATLWTLAHRVVDAEYNAAAGTIVTVSANPSRLHVVDAEARTTQSVDLPQVPLSVSVAPSGTHAAVSHDGYVSYVNLATRTVEKTYPVRSVGGDVVLAGNGYAYVFPRADQWVDVHCINMATGAETLSPYPGPRAGTLVRLHPSGDYIYGANNGLSPNDIEKYDVRPGTATRMYDSPYHGDYNFAGNLWISGDGTRLFARSGNVFRSSTVRAEDMTYAGALSGVAAVQAAVQLNAASRIYVLASSAPPPSYWSPDPVPATDVRAYEPQFLGYKGAARLPSFKVPTSTGGTIGYAADGRYLFENAGGTRVYAVVRAPDGSGIANDWAVAAFDVADLP